MLRFKAISSARARFAAIAVTVMALVALGGVAPAVAADVNVTVTVNDAAQGGVYANKPIVLQSSGGATYNFTTNGSGQFYTGTVGPIPEGSYRLIPGGQYAPTAYFTFVAGQSTATVAITKPKIAGSIPAAASGHTTVRVEMEGFFPGGGSYFAEVSNFVVSSVDGSFAHLLQTGTGTYRLKFEPDANAPYLDTYSDPIVVDGWIDTVVIGAVPLTAAGSISGTVTSTPGGAAIGGATVRAHSGATLVASATTASNGTYLLKLPASSASLTISAEASGFTGSSYAGNPVSLTAGNSYTVGSVNLSLTRLPINLSGNTVGGGGGAYVVDTYLYKKDGTGRFAQVPYGTAMNSSTFSFTDLPDGDYRLAFRNTDTERTLVWQSLTDNGSGQNATDSYGLCYYPFTMNSAAGSRALTNIRLADEQQYPARCAAPAYSEGGDPVVTGTILNGADLGSIIYAKLYKVGPSGSTVVDISQVEWDGSFALTGALDAGEYYIKIVPHENDHYLPTLLGDGGVTEWSRDAQTDVDFAADHSFTIDPVSSTGYSGHDVTLEAGAKLDGYILSNDFGSFPASLTMVNADDPSDTIDVPVNDGGGFWIVLPVGGRYTMLAESLNGAYAAEYWENASDLADAQIVGPLTAGNFGTYEFHLDRTPPTLFGFVTDYAMNDAPITVHLFQRDSSGLWQPVDAKDTVSEEVQFSNLTEGDFRMRFERDGLWLPADSHRTGTLPDSGSAINWAPSCFVDFDDVTAGLPSFIEVEVNFDAPSLICAAEPPVKGTVSGHVVSSPATGSVNVAGAGVYLQNNNTFAFASTVTDVNGNFEFADVTNGSYTLTVSSVDNHVNGTYEYYYSADDHVFTGGQDLGDIEATRFGNVSGTITNWDNATMSGATATVYRYCACDSSWHEVSAEIEIGATGYFEVPAIDENGQYSVFIDFEDTYVDTFVGGGADIPTAPFTGVAEMDYQYPPIALGIVEMVTIRGTVFFGSIPVENAEVYAETTDGEYYWGYADEDGLYEVEVPPNTDYLVAAYRHPLQLQYYDGVNYDSNYQDAYTGTTVSVGTDEVTGIDFSLVGSPEDYFRVHTLADTGFGPYSLTGAEVHLYKYVVDGWVEVDASQSPYADLYSSGGGDYRMRFSMNGEWLRVGSMSWENDLPPYEASNGDIGVNDCFIEFDDLVLGSYLRVETLLDADGSASGCGPEVTVEHREVVGAIVQSDAFANAPIVGQTVTLTNTSTSNVFTRTTDANGVFSFTDVSDGVYTLEVPSMTVPAGNSYVGSSQTVVVAGDASLDPIKLTRIGSVELQIGNWDIGMAGAVAELRLEDQNGDWTPVATDSVDSSGAFDLAGVTVSGDYRVWVDYPGELVDGYAVDYDDPAETLEESLVAENDAVLGTVAFTTVSGVAYLGANPVASATVTAEAWLNGWVFDTTTDADGEFSVAVPANITYTMEASKAGLVRALITTLPVTTVAANDVLLDMHYATFLAAIFDGPVTSLPSATVHLYRQVSGGWQEVGTDTGAMAYVATDVSGSYRIRISDGADWLAISAYEWQNAAYPAENSGPSASPVPNVCVLDFTPASAGAEYEINIEVDTASTVNCGAEPAVFVPAVTPPTAVKPGFSPRPGTDTTGAVDQFDAEAPTDTETETDTETDEPTTTDDGDDTAGGSAEEGDGDGESASSFDVPVGVWVAIVVALLVLIGGGVFLFRRRL